MDLLRCPALMSHSLLHQRVKVRCVDNCCVLFICMFVAINHQKQTQHLYITGKATCQVSSRSGKVPSTGVSSSLAPEGQGSDEQLIVVMLQCTFIFVAIQEPSNGCSVICARPGSIVFVCKFLP